MFKVNLLLGKMKISDLNDMLQVAFDNGKDLNRKYRILFPHAAISGASNLDYLKLTPMQYASQNDDIILIKKLIMYQCMRPSSKYQRNLDKALNKACISRSPEATKLLLKHGANPLAPGCSSKHTAIISACGNGKGWYLRKCLKKTNMVPSDIIYYACAAKDNAYSINLLCNAGIELPRDVLLNCHYTNIWFITGLLNSTLETSSFCNGMIDEALEYNTKLFNSFTAEVSFGSDSPRSTLKSNDRGSIINRIDILRKIKSLEPVTLL